MKYVFYAVLCCLCSVGLCLASDSHPMNDRVFVNHEAGTSFRFPFTFTMPNQYGDTIVQNEYFWKTVKTKKGKTVQRPRLKKGVNVKHFSFLQSELKEHLKDADLSTILEYHIGVDGWQKHQAYEYYSKDPNLPHRSTDWAIEGIKGWEGFQGNIYAFILTHGDRFSGLVFTGKIDEVLRKKIVSSFEIMNSPDKKTRSTWRAYKSRRGYVYNEKGEANYAVRAKRPKEWKNTWQVETAHFHISAICEPRELKRYCDHLEGVYEGLKSYLPVEKPMHFKLEIHMTKTRAEFHKLSDAVLGLKDSNKDRGSGSVRGGFFNVQSLATYSFTDRVRHSKLSPYLALAHEVTHQYTFVGSNYNYSLLTWINEALAVMFEEGRLDTRKKFKLKVPKQRLLILKRYYKEYGMVGKVESYAAGCGIGNVHQYAEVYAMLHQFLTENDGKESLKEFWEGLKAGKNGTKLLNDIFLKKRFKGKDRVAALKEWEEDIISYVKRGKANKVLR